MKTIKQIIYIVGKENRTGLIFLLLLNLLNFFLEFISILSIPLFTAALLGEQLNFKNFNTKLSFLENDNVLLYTTLLVIISFLLKNFLLAFHSFFQAKFLKKIRSNLSKKFFNYYFENSNITLSDLKPSIMARNVTHVVQGFYAYCENLNKLIRDLVAGLTIAIIISFINLKISLTLAFLFLLISFLYFTYLRPKIKKKAEQNQEIISNFNKMIFETFEAIKEIKVYQKEKLVSQIFEKKVDHFEKNFFFFSVFDKFPRIILEVITIFSILAISFIMINYSSNIYQELPLLALIVVSAIRMIPVFSGLSSSLFYMRAYTISVETAYEQLKVIELNKSKQKSFSNYQENFEKNLNILKNYLVLDNVSFSYEKNKKLIDRIDVKIPKNSHVSIVGTSGSGKTTLQSIMMGLIKPDTGNVFFENQNINSINENWMKKISYVSQKVFLFDDTIKRNICLNFDGSKIDEQKLKTAVSIAELKGKINSLKNKLDENVGPDGKNLSGGERQRVALARAIYKKTDIIFLDEFTSNLDLETEKKIMSNLKNNLPDTTVIMISHRLEIARNSDIIIEIDKK